MARFDRKDVIPVILAAIVGAFLLFASYKLIVDEPIFPSAAAASESGGHIPFTSKDVTPGDPQSYVGTVGQCPFYEMAGEKGCYPPADIECNADWSVCTKKEVSTPIPTNQSPPAGSQAAENHPTVVNCTESK